LKVLQTAPITVGYGLYKAAKNPPKYQVNGDPATRADIIDVLDSNDPEAIAGVNATIENDPELKNRLAKAKKDIADNAVIKRNLEEAGVTNQNDIDEMTALEEEAEKLKGNNTRAGKRRLAEINQRIDEILDKPSVEQEIDQSIEVTDEEVLDRIKKEKGEDGVYTTEEFNNVKELLIKEKKDAIQEPSTTEVDVQESTEDSSQVGEGDPEVTATQESQEVTEGEPDQTTQEEVTQESQDLETLINDSPVEVTTQETTEVTEDSPAPQREVNDNLNVVDQEKTDSYYKSERFSKENPNTNQQKHESMLMDRANKAVKAIQKILPNTKVILHRSEESYSQYIDTPSRGAFEPNTNTIHINMPKATGKTIAHEVLHAVLKQKLGAEVNIQNASKNMVASVRKAIAKSKKLTSEQTWLRTILNLMLLRRVLLKSLYKRLLTL